MDGKGDINMTAPPAENPPPAYPMASPPMHSPAPPAPQHQMSQVNYAATPPALDPASAQAQAGQHYRDQR